MTLYHPQRKFQQVAVDMHSVTSRTPAGNFKILETIDTLKCYARAIQMPDGRATIVARLVLDEWVSIYGPAENILSK